MSCTSLKLVHGTHYCPDAVGTDNLADSGRFDGVLADSVAANELDSLPVGTKHR